uniref:transmembrane protein 62-like n=1 Tax=Styela clava TaxID=7725 RepID=UPI00193AC5E6|nr:transmembrane protein 62-like [Styela clava]
MGRARLLSVCHVFLISSLCIIVSIYAFYKPEPRYFHEMKSNNGPYPSDSNDNLFWFVQVSDIHTSKFWKSDQVEAFDDFCNSTLSTINPELVLVTGDLTDAKEENKIDSRQFEEEWKIYHSIITKNNVTEKCVWLDIRGNHDAFDVARANDANSNYYLKYSGDKGKLSSAVYQVEKQYGKYSFIPVDATMIPGPRRPYNFMGYLSERSMEKLENFEHETASDNFTIWYGHYPTSTITNFPPRLTRLVGKRGGVYLAGHLHKYCGRSEIYAVNPHGFLELELEDWKDNKMYRIAAIDHDIFSFTDLKYSEWPAIVLTNPKKSKFMMPNAEPIGMIKQSSHIRFLVFDPWKIVRVQVRIDGILMEEKARQVSGGPLWVCKWNTSLYRVGTHDLSITVSDSRGNKKTIDQKFSLDSTWELDVDPFSAFILLTDFPSLFFYLFYMTSILYLIFILSIRFHRHEVWCGSMTKCRLLMEDDIFYYGTIAFALNIMFGPWFIGELTRGNIGICFAFGMFINGEIIPEGWIYYNGIWKILTLYFPGIPLLAYFDYFTGRNKTHTIQGFASKWRICGFLCLFVFYIYLHVKSWHEIFLAYGLITGICSPVSLWWLLFIIHKTWRIYRKGSQNASLNGEKRSLFCKSQCKSIHKCAIKVGN